MNLTNTKNLIAVTSKVTDAISRHEPVVALESTVITHGMPYPRNLEVALELEEILVNKNVMPAFTAVINGVVKAGLTHDELRHLASSEQSRKAGVRDLASCVYFKHTAGTTVSATVRIATLLGIKVFATGGIGGVHRDYLESMDVSADLLELTRSSMIVICAGAKLLLDVLKTFEYLEALSIPVAVYRSDFIPGFYVAETELKAPLRLDQIKDIVDIYNIRKSMDLNGVLLVLNPISKNKELKNFNFEEIIKSALSFAHKKNVSGQAMTPFLLAEITKQTDGKSLLANVELIKQNVQLAADVSIGLMG